MPNLTAADFRWDGHCWAAMAQLDCWRGFQSRRGSYGACDSLEPSDGTVALVFAPEGRDGAPLGDAEVALARWPLERGGAMQEPLLAGLMVRYASLRPRYARFLGKEYERSMPPVEDVRGFQTLIGLHTIYVHQVQKSGLPYVGFEFGCTWDTEHGLGVLMHGTRVVEIGGADTAFLLWIAERDGG
jgi:uncharacterized protein DUF6985